MATPNGKRRAYTLRAWVLLGSVCLTLHAWLGLSAARGRTAIVPDTTLATYVSRYGRVFLITGGTRPYNGANLFHSFLYFSIGQGDTASFDSPPGVQNILSRVTGGTPSIIDGLLQSSGAGVNLYLLNPSGVIFAPRASLDVRGSVHVSTADVLRLADGAAFVARQGAASHLTTAAPAAFGFLQAHPAKITVRGSHLGLAAGATLSLVGGDIEIRGGRIERESLSPPDAGIRIHLLSLAAPGEVPLNPPPSFAGLQGGTITLTEATQLNLSGNGGGTLFIRGGRLHIDHETVINANTLGFRNAAPVGVDIAVTGSMHLAGGSQINTNAVIGGGAAGAIQVRAGQVHITGGAEINSNTTQGGPGGAINITANTVVISGEGSHLSTSTAGTQPAGTVRIRASTVLLQDGSSIQTTTSGSGPAGTVTIRAPGGSIRLEEGAQILSSTAGSLSTGGNVGGTIRLVAHTITLRDDAGISTQSIGSGDAGDIYLNASRTLRSTNSIITTGATQAQGGTIRIRAPLLHLRHSDITTTVTNGNKSAGNIFVDSRVVVLQEESHIRANAEGGPGGNIRLKADAFLADASSTVTASSHRNVAGEIDIRAPVTNLRGLLAALPQEPLQGDDVVSDPCAARRLQGHRSSFVARERDGVPETPASGLSSRLYVSPAPRHTATAALPSPGKPSGTARHQGTGQRPCPPQ